MSSTAPLRIGYVPEHFSTPLHYALSRFGLSAVPTPFPSGTGAMVAALRAGELDAAIGLTEGWVAGLGTPAGGGASAGGYKLVARYVDSPLRWAISTGASRAHPAAVADLRGARLGVSRLGSGSHVMGFVLADQQGWGAFGAVVPLGAFAQLRRGVGDGDQADFFMWEHFTSKRYYRGEAGAEARDDLIRSVGDIYTPWPSWHIVAVDEADERLPALFEALDRGIKYFGENPAESVQYISDALDYSSEDAEEWMKTVRFSTDGVKGVRRAVVQDTVKVLRKAGVLAGDADEAPGMIGIERTD